MRVKGIAAQTSRGKPARIAARSMRWPVVLIIASYHSVVDLGKRAHNADLREQRRIAAKMRG